jgi:hypothetical protein
MKLTINTDEEELTAYGIPSAIVKSQKDELYFVRIVWNNGIEKKAQFDTKEERDKVAERIEKMTSITTSGIFTLAPSYDEDDTDNSWSRIILTDRPKQAVFSKEELDGKTYWTVSIDGVTKKYDDEKVFIDSYDRFTAFIESFAWKN